MTKANIISAGTANRLFWLGRYEERVYVTMHLLRKCYDQMIDGSPTDYHAFWKKFDVENTYASNDEFEYGMLYDEQNVSSVLSCLNRAMDNAMVLRSDIKSETLSYLEMSVAKMHEKRAENNTNITCLQQLTDWSLAFFGSVEQRIENRVVLGAIFCGRIIEYIDALLRFEYPLERLQYSFEGLLTYTKTIPSLVDEEALAKIDALLVPELYESKDLLTANTTKLELMMLLGRVVRV